MSLAKPDTFAVDKIFEANKGWYVGSQHGFSVGPYESEDVAKAQSSEIKGHLGRADNTGQTLHIIRELLETRDVGYRRPGEAQSVRAGETPRLRYRAERFFALEGKWYFMTREGVDVGPYDSRSAAERDAVSLVRLLKECETEEQAHRAIYEFMARPVASPRGAPDEM